MVWCSVAWMRQNSDSEFSIFSVPGSRIVFILKRIEYIRPRGREPYPMQSAYPCNRGIWTIRSQSNGRCYFALKPPPHQQYSLWILAKHPLDLCNSEQKASMLRIESWREGLLMMLLLSWRNSFVFLFRHATYIYLLNIPYIWIQTEPGFWTSLNNDFEASKTLTVAAQHRRHEAHILYI